MTPLDCITTWFRHHLLGYASSDQTTLHRQLVDEEYDRALIRDRAGVKLSHRSLRRLTNLDPGCVQLAVHYLCTDQPTSYRTYRPVGRWWYDLINGIWWSPVASPNSMIRWVLDSGSERSHRHLYDHLQTRHCSSLLLATHARPGDHWNRALERCPITEEVVAILERHHVHAQNQIPLRPEVQAYQKAREQQPTV